MSINNLIMFGSTLISGLFLLFIKLYFQKTTDNIQNMIQSIEREIKEIKKGELWKSQIENINREISEMKDCSKELTNIVSDQGIEMVKSYVNKEDCFSKRQEFKK